MFGCSFLWRSFLFFVFSSATNSVWRGGGGGGGGDVEDFFSIYETPTPLPFSLYRFVKRFVQICSFFVVVVSTFLLLCYSSRERERERERERDHSLGFWKAGKFSEEKEEEEQVQRNIDRCARNKIKIK